MQHVWLTPVCVCEIQYFHVTPSVCFFEAFHPRHISSPVQMIGRSHERGVCKRLGRPGGRLNIKMSSYQYRDSHVKDKTVSPTVLSLTWKSPYLGKTFFILRRGPDRVVSLAVAAVPGCGQDQWFCYTAPRISLVRRWETRSHVTQ